MKKSAALFTALALVIVFTGCQKDIPSLSFVADNGIKWAENNLIGKTIDECIEVWGTSADNWETEQIDFLPRENGYLWLCNEGRTAVILYADSDGRVTTAAITRDAGIDDLW